MTIRPWHTWCLFTGFQDISDAQRWFDFFTGSSVRHLSTPSDATCWSLFHVFFFGNEKVLDKQYLSLVKVALTFEIKTWKLIDYCGFWIACLMRDMQLTYGDVMCITVWEVLVVSYCKMIINDSTLYLMMLIISFPEELHLTRMCGLCEFEVAKPAVF